MRINKTDTTVIKDELYPMIEKSLNSSNTKAKYKNCIQRFISKRSAEIYDNLPCSRIFFGQDDVDDFFNSIGIKEKEVDAIIKKTYYGEVKNFNPKAAQNPFTVALLMVIRYFYLHKNAKELDISMVYLAFSGKFYPSIHYRSYKQFVPVKYVMEYVINHRLNKRYDIVVNGSLFSTMLSIAKTWITTYADRLEECSDEDVVYMVQQLHSRIGSFMKNIADEYYKVYEEKDTYIVYDSDNYDPDDFHMADSNILRTQRVVEKAMSKITSGVDLKICNMCADSNIRPLELKSIIESILSDPKTTIKLREFCDLIVASYLNSGGGTDVRDIEFITYSSTAKPNAKQKEFIRQKEIINELLEDNSSAYIRRRSRLSTKTSYERSLKLYFILCIHTANTK